MLVSIGPGYSPNIPQAPWARYFIIQHVHIPDFFRSRFSCFSFFDLLSLYYHRVTSTPSHLPSIYFTPCPRLNVRAISELEFANVT